MNVLPKGKAHFYMTVPTQGGNSTLHEVDMLVDDHMAATMLNILKRYTNTASVTITERDGITTWRRDT